MVRLDYLEPFETYKTNPPIIMPEIKSNRKKNIAVMVLAHNVEEELAWLSQTKELKFKNLYRYFIEKRWTHTMYKSGYKVIKINAEGDISDLLAKYRAGNGNLKNIADVTSFIPNPASNTNPLKEFNVLVEANYGVSRILENPKDKRLAKLKAAEILDEYIRIAKMIDSDMGGVLGSYSRYAIIPMDLWFKKEDFTNPKLLLKINSTNIMGQILRMLTDRKKLMHFNKVYLTFGRYVLPLVVPANNLSDDESAKLIATCIERFMIKVRVADVPEFTLNDEERTIVNDTSVLKLEKAEKDSKVEVITDKVMEKTHIDPATTNPDTVEKVEKVVAKAVNKNRQVAPPPAITQKDAGGVEHPMVIPSGTVAPTEHKPVTPKEPEEKPVKVNAPLERVPVDTIHQKHADEPVTVDDADDEAEIDKVVDDLQLDSSDLDTIVSARLAGQTIQSYQRNEKLKEKYKDLFLGDVKLSEIVKTSEEYEIPDKPIHADTVIEGLQTIKASEFERAYNEQLAEKDLVSILLHFSSARPAMFLNKDIKVEDASTPTDRLIRYTVEFEDEGRKRHRFSFLLPKMYKDRYLYLNDQSMNIVHQKLPFPVTKVSPEKCQAVTNYNKIFVERYGGNYSPRIAKIKKLFTGPQCPKFAKVETGDVTAMNHVHLTTIEHDELGSSMVSLQMMYKDGSVLKLYFAVDEAAAVIDKNLYPHVEGETSPLLPLGIKTYRNQPKVKPKMYYISGTTNMVYTGDGGREGELSDFIVEQAIQCNEKIADEFAELSAGTRFVYTRAKIMNEFIPTIIMLSAADPQHLVGVLDKAQIKYEFVTKRPTVDKDLQGVVPFSDGWLVYDRYPYENSLLLNGLTTFPTREFSFYDLLARDAYVDIFELMFGRRSIIDGIENFYYMFVDPITRDVLNRLGMPTDFTKLMLYCNDVLADNTYQIDSDYHNTRLRSNEIIYADLYKELADAWGKYRVGRAEKFSIPENAVIKYLLTANIVDPHSELNLTLETENDRQVKLKGPSGMNEERSFTLEKRAYHPTMRGIIGMNATPSGEVGINRHLTINPNIIDARGFVQIEKSDYDGTELVTPGEMLQTFGPESSDIERVAMAISQSKHVVPVEDATACPVSYDMERVIPYLSTDFAYSAKKDGKVVAIENDLLIIQYDDGTFDDVDLSERPARNTDGGFYIMNKLDTDLKVGAKVRKGQLVAVDRKYINNHDTFGDPLANVGTLARIAVETNGGVYEDSCYITDALAHRMATKITRQKRVILSKYANIKYMASIGTAVKTNDAILLFDDTQDEFTSQMLAAMAVEADDEDEVIASTAPVISKYSGVIKDIRIYHSADVTEMTPSLRKLVEAYDKQASSREKMLDKYMGSTNANTIVKTSQKLEPDSTGKIKGVQLPDGIIIDFYIEYVDIMAPGDKLSFFSALKGIVSDIIPADQAAYAESNPDRKIDACLSCIGVYKRMTLDICKVGMMCKIVVEKKRMLKEKFGPAVKAELKKK